MKIVSWNINGIRAVVRKGLIDFMNHGNADIYCFQEIKISQKDIDIIMPVIDDMLENKYEFHWFPAQKSGYSGVMTCTKIMPRLVIKGIQYEEFDNEGRAITLEMDDFYLVNCYFPNTQRGLERMEYKLRYNQILGDYADELRKKKPVIITGDFNVAHKEIDLKNPKQNEKNAGYTIEERNSFDTFLKRGYIDTFREFEKGPDFYTWWAYFANSRARNIGWRIDYFVVSDDLKDKLISSKIYKDVMGSDHCPIELEFITK